MEPVRTDKHKNSSGVEKKSLDTKPVVNGGEHELHKPPHEIKEGTKAPDVGPSFEPAIDNPPNILEKDRITHE